MKTIVLSAKQRHEIEQRRRQISDRRIFQRLSALLWIAEGRTRQEVAELLGVSSRQVGDWLRIFRNKGLDALCSLHYRGDPGRLRPAQVQQLKQEIAKGTFHNTEQVRAWIEEHFGITYSSSGSTLSLTQRTPSRESRHREALWGIGSGHYFRGTLC